MLYLLKSKQRMRVSQTTIAYYVPIMSQFAVSFSDWRSFNRAVYEEMKANGEWGDLLKRCNSYLCAVSPTAAHMLVVQPEELPITFRASSHLGYLVDGIRALLKRIGDGYDSGSNIRNVMHLSEQVAEGRATYNACTLRHWTLNFVKNAGMFTSRISYKRRNPYSIINDEVTRTTMKAWMKQASRAHPPATGKDFMHFIAQRFNCKISERSAHCWLYLLGFRYRDNRLIEFYNDGHNRPDVKQALAKYIIDIKSIYNTGANTYYGDSMEHVYNPAQDVTEQFIVSYHDESAIHANDCQRRAWKLAGQTGIMKAKNKGICMMIAGYVCAEFGFWKDSLRIIVPSADGYWGGIETQEQAVIHLMEFDVVYPHSICIDVYDNSSGHNCYPADALNVNKLNKLAGGKNKPNIRDGYYVAADGSVVQQHLFFRVGDKILHKINSGHNISSDRCTTLQYEVGYVIEQSLVLGYPLIVNPLQEHRISLLLFLSFDLV